MTEKIFAVPIALQVDAIKKHCLGDCGKGLLALVEDPEWGAMQMCKQTECPFLHSEMDEPFGQIDEYLVYLRRISDEDKSRL